MVDFRRGERADAKSQKVSRSLVITKDWRCKVRPRAARYYSSAPRMPDLLMSLSDESEVMNRTSYTTYSIVVRVVTRGSECIMDYRLDLQPLNSEITSDFSSSLTGETGPAKRWGGGFSAAFSKRHFRTN